MNTTKSIWINPFQKIAGKEALGIGVALLLLSALVASFTRTQFDGVLDVHYALSDISLMRSIMEQVINLGALVLVFYPLALALGSRHTRLIDLAGTFSMARLAYLPLTLLNISGFMSNFGSTLLDNLSAGEDPFTGYSSGDMAFFTLSILVLVIAVLVYLIWLFQAYKVSTHLKGTRLWISFFGGIFLAEIISKIGHVYLF